MTVEDFPEDPHVQSAGTVGRDVLMSARGASFSYDGEKTDEPNWAIEQLDLELKDEEFLCLIGPSGCGKTTVLNMMAGFLMPTEGDIILRGQRVRGPSAAQGVVFQGDDSLFPWLTAIQNVAFGLRMRGLGRDVQTETAARFVKLVGLSGHEHKYPTQLSGGMRQRIQIARVLANDPDLLLMDEPFAALDAQTRSELQDELVDIWLASRKTVLFITHDIAEAVLLADRVGVLTKGPGSRIRTLFDIDLPRPRSRANPKFGEWYERLDKAIRREARGAE